MPSSYIVGLNPQYKTFGAAGFSRDYTSLATWESDTDDDLVTLQISPTLICFRDSASYAQTVVMAGATTNTSYFRSIIASSAYKHYGNPARGVIFTNTTDATLININESNASVQGIVATQTLNSSVVRAAFAVGSGNTGVSLIGCIAYNCQNSGAGSLDGFSDSGIATKIVNCAAIKCKTRGIFVAPNIAGTSYLYNNTAALNGSGFVVGANRTCVAKNNLAHGNTSANYTNTGTITGSQHNASSNTEVFGSTGVRISQTFTFADAASDVYRLTRADAGARNFGVDLRADSIFAFFDDGKGLDRGAVWSMGFDEPSDVVVGGVMAWRGYLKQSTAVTVKVGPFLNSADGYTPETGLTILRADVRLSKNAGDMAQKSETTTLVHDELGFYDCALNTTDTNTLGRLMLTIQKSPAMIVQHEFVILSAQVYDSIVGNADLLQVDMTQWLGTAPLALASQRVPSLLGAADANTITAAALAADAVTEIQSGLSTFNPAVTAVSLDLSQTPSATPVEGTVDDAFKRLVTSIPLNEEPGQLDGLATAYNVDKYGVKVTVATVASAGDFTISFSGYGGNIETDGQFDGMQFVFEDGPNQGVPKRIGTYTGSATYRVQFTGATHRDGPFPNTPVVGNQGIIIGRG